MIARFCAKEYTFSFWRDAPEVKQFPKLPGLRETPTKDILPALRNTSADELSLQGPGQQR